MMADLMAQQSPPRGRDSLVVGNGHNRPVLMHEIGEYLDRYVEARLMESKQAVTTFRNGLTSIIPESALFLLNWEEFQTLVCGARIIDAASDLYFYSKISLISI